MEEVRESHRLFDQTRAQDHCRSALAKDSHLKVGIRLEYVGVVGTLPTSPTFVPTEEAREHL